MLKNIKSALIKKESLKSTKTYELKLSDLTSYKKKKKKFEVSFSIHIILIKCGILM